MARKRRKRTKRLYFTQEHEDAIIAYNNSTDPRERTLLYANYIQPAFNEMVDKIVFTYKFTTLPNIEDLREECKIYLTTILDKFKPEKGSKAFSYFSVITKNWFIHKVKKNTLQNKREVDFEELSVEHQLRYASVTLKCDEKREEREFWDLLRKEMEGWEKMKLKANEEKVLQAVKILLEDRDNPNLIFNKKAIYLYIREITGLNTKQVVNNLNKLRSKYKVFKHRWNEGQF
jgi:DNA-directed RNA polymerase specialized sigma subunit